MPTLLTLIALLAMSAATPPPAAGEPFGPPWTALLGSWTGEGEGQPGAGGGASTFELDLERHVMLRRSHADYPAGAGRPAAHHEDLMVLYPAAAAGPMRAIYFDNEGHVVEYTGSWSADAATLTLTSAASPGSPGFRLVYRVLAPGRMSVSFDVAAPGGEGFKTYVSGVLRRAGGA
jgi:hypothetical protein